MATLNIIGCGRAGRTLGRLWAQGGVYAIGEVFDVDPAIAASALAFIGGGRIASSIGAMASADVWMLTPPDGRIAACCTELAANGQLAAGNVVFHCSGALPSAELDAALARGAHTASAHPLKSFADPAGAAQTFRGTAVALEGDTAALEELTAAFKRIGAVPLQIRSDAKTVYHAASVIVCNYLAALMEAGLRCYESAGYEREAALSMAEPLVRETLDNVFRLGPVRALTGPIARGDQAIVERHLIALERLDPRLAAVYRELGAIAVDLARSQGGVAEEALAAIERELNKHSAS
jgi:predicted short-subunit dehydrogenase-like oxidoreductase (DUF2520 family)